MGVGVSAGLRLNQVRQSVCTVGLKEAKELTARTVPISIGTVRTQLAGEGTVRVALRLPLVTVAQNESAEPRISTSQGVS